MKINISRRSFLGGIIAATAVVTAPTNAAGFFSQAIIRPKYSVTPFPEEFDLIVRIIGCGKEILSRTVAKGKSNVEGVNVDVPVMEALTSGVPDYCELEMDGQRLCSIWFARDSVPAVPAGGTILLSDVVIRID